MNEKTTGGFATAYKDDDVNYPKHYTNGKIDVLDFILDQDLLYIEGNIIKYICRHKLKNGLEDVKKAEFFIKKLIEQYQ